jgi:LCP family protein required for cell wall assembly
MDSLRRQPRASRPPALLPPHLPEIKGAPAEPLRSRHAPPNVPLQRTPSILHTAFIVFAAILILIFGALAFLSYKSIRISGSLQFENKASFSFLSHIRQLTSSFTRDKRTPLRGEENGRINILLLGRAGERYPGRNLTDTVMIMSIDTENKKVALLSLPRDLYAPIPGTDLYTKINSLYQYSLNTGKGIDPMKESVEEITGQPIHYFIILDFDGFEKAVDALNGISVDVVRDFYDTRYPGKNYSYETFEIKQGWQVLDGKTALKYVRERHNDPEGDFGRAKRQQQVIQAIKDKAFSIGTFLNVFALNDLLDALGESVKTDMEPESMQSFLELARTLDTENVTTQVIDAWKKDSLLRVSHIQVGPVAAFILVPRVGNWSEIRDTSENIFHLDALRERKDRIASEQATLAILYRKNDFALAKKLSGLIRDDMAFGAISLVPLDALENRPEQSIIVDRSGLSKPFSLDELIRKFALKKESVLPSGISLGNDSDFAIVIGDDLTGTLDFEEGDAAAISADDVTFPEALPPQPRQKKR